MKSKKNEDSKYDADCEQNPLHSAKIEKREEECIKF
jgi:hypothetical protein